MLSESSTVIGLIIMIITFCTVIGGVFAFRGTVNKTAGEIQARVIAAMEQEHNVLHAQIDELRLHVKALEQENNQQAQIITTICEAMKGHGLHIRVDKDMVMVTSGNDVTSLRIRGSV